MIRLNVFIRTTDSNREEVVNTARELVAASLKDEGCVAYDLFESTTRNDVLMICETWSDAKALAASTQFGSCVFANKPGDGSAREQAASCQKVLGGFANICYEYATKRYRSNCINWGILPFTIDQGTPFDYQPGDCVFVPGIRAAIEAGREDIPAQVICRDGSVHDLLLHVRGLTQDEKEIILDGCLMNYYAARM